MQQLIMSDINDLSDSNSILKGEISDLTNNENSIELYAREKFGYIKKRESFVQIMDQRCHVIHRSQDEPSFVR